MTTPLKVTAVKGKSAVLVLNWGGSPFAREATKRGSAIIPHGFRVEVKSDSKIWIGETRVKNGGAQYCFCLKQQPEVRSEWRNNPTAAYKEASERAGNVKFSKGSNGRLIIGITYENLQVEIRKVFRESLKEAGINPDEDINEDSSKTSTDSSSSKRQKTDGNSSSSPRDSLEGSSNAADHEDETIQVLVKMRASSVGETTTTTTPISNPILVSATSSQE